MKKFVYSSVILLIISLIPLSAQVTIGSGKQPEPFSILEMDSKEGGVRFNQLEKTDKDNLTRKLEESQNKNLTNGLSIFDMDANKHQYWDGDKWAQIISVENNQNVDGGEGQFLMSNGKNKYPEWTTIYIPTVVNGEFYMHSSTVKKDMKGVILPYTGEHNYENYEKGQVLNGTSKNWYELTDLETKIHIPETHPKPGDPTDKVYTRVAVEIQTGAQMIVGPNTVATFKVFDEQDKTNKIVKLKENSWISFGIGIFIGNSNEPYKLEHVRATRLEGSANNAFSIFTVIGAIDNLPAGDHILKVAVKRRSHAFFMDTYAENGQGEKINISIGRPIPGLTNFNNLMAQSFLRTDVYVVPE